MDFALNTPQYLFDDSLIDGGYGDGCFPPKRLVRRWLPCSVLPNPVLRPEMPWEGRAVFLYGSIIPDPSGGYRMYYTNYAPGKGHSFAMLATSADGFRWKRPELGLVEFDGSTANNIVFTTQPGWVFDSPCVIHDPADSSWPCKMACFQHNVNDAMWKDSFGMYTFRSADGLRWEQLPGKGGQMGAPSVRMGDRSSFYRDARSGKYVYLSRQPEFFEKVGVRHVARTDSDDFASWSAPELILAPDFDDEPDVQFYGMPVFQRHGWYFGLLEYWHDEQDVIEVHLAISRDGKRWQRPHRTPFIAATYPWNRAWNTCSNTAPIIVNEQMLFHLGGRWQAHGWDTARMDGSIGIASLPLDRFCAIEGGAGGSSPLCPSRGRGATSPSTPTPANRSTRTPPTATASLPWKSSTSPAVHCPTGRARRRRSSTATLTAAAESGQARSCGRGSAASPNSAARPSGCGFTCATPGCSRSWRRRRATGRGEAFDRRYSASFLRARPCFRFA